MLQAKWSEALEAKFGQRLEKIEVTVGQVRKSIRRDINNVLIFIAGFVVVHACDTALKFCR